jgi:pimeloyl-ACP methyl ester carboxylesterase
MGQDTTPLGTIGLSTWVDAVVALLQESPEPVVLVGHSMGGMVITAAADALPAQVRVAVYVCAFLPLDGEMLLELATRPEGASTALQQVPTADGLALTVSPESARAAFYGLCPPAAREAAIARLTPQTLRAVIDPVRLKHVVAVPRVYIECTADRAMPIQLQRFMAGRSPGIRVHTLDADHSPFLSRPAELLAILQNQL